MKTVNLKSLISVYLTGNPDLFARYIEANGISEAQRGMRKSEMDDIRVMVSLLEKNGADTGDLDNFYIGYSIPQIGKEFDMLRFGVDSVVNIEIKQTASPGKVEKQLMRNAYYLGFLGCRDKHFYTFVCDSATMYRWDGNRVEECDVGHLVNTLRSQVYMEIADIDSLFDPTNYLVSPFNSTKAFVQGCYFLTKHQEEIRNAIVASVECRRSKYMAVTGRPGTGKTLLVYDIASDLKARGYQVLILHCAKLNNGHVILINDYGWEIKCTRYGVGDTAGSYDIIIVDEAQRIYPVQLGKLLTNVGPADKMCIFSYDEGQCLSYDEIRWEQSKRIEALCGSNVYRLTEKIRTNKEIAEFIRHFMKHNYRSFVTDFPHVSASYSRTVDEAKEVLKMYASRGWKVPTYTPGLYSRFDYEDYNIESESAHQVIGQEFDDVVAVIDSHFCYDENDKLATKGRADKVYSQRNMFYQIVTRTRKRLHILVIDNPDMMAHIIDIVSGRKSLTTPGRPETRG